MADLVNPAADIPRLAELARRVQEDQWHRHDTEAPLSLNSEVFGFPLHVISNRSSILDTCRVALSRFTQGPARQAERPIVLRLFAREAGRSPHNLPLDNEADGRVRFDYDGCDDWAAIDFGEHGHVALDLNNRAAVGFLSQLLADRTELVARFIVSTTLLNLLARCGLVQWHAASLLKESKAAMLIGTDNSGKSTTALALLRAGYRILGESLTYTRQAADGIELMGFPIGHLRLREEGMSFFPEWREAGLRSSTHEGDKWLLDLHRIMPDQVMTNSQTCARVAMLFVGVATGQVTQVRRIAEGEAMLSAVPACSLWEGERETKRILRDVRHMIQHLPCYQILVGRDLDLVVRAVDQVLEGL